MSYSASERATVIRTDDETKKWILYTYQSTIKTKMRKIGVEPKQVFSDGGMIFELDFNQVTFRKRGQKRPLNEEQRKIRSERMKEIHKKKNKDI